MPTKGAQVLGTGRSSPSLLEKGTLKSENWGLLGQLLNFGSKYRRNSAES